MNRSIAFCILKMMCKMHRMFNLQVKSENYNINAATLQMLQYTTVIAVN